MPASSPRRSIPIPVPQRKGDPILFSEDESARPDTTIEKLAALPTIYGSATVTAGNAPGLNTGASAMVLMAPEEAESRGIEPLATLVGSAMASGHPDRIASIPAESARLVLEKTGLTIDDIDVIEINEAFAAVPLVATLVMAGRDEAKAEAIRAEDERERRLDRDRAPDRRDRRAPDHDADLRAPTPPGGRRMVAPYHGLATICGGIGEAEAFVVRVGG